MGERDYPRELYEPSYSIKDFCRVENISRFTYDKLAQMGFGPKVMRFPGGIDKLTITHAARLEWQQKMQNPSPEQREQIERLLEKKRQKGRDAAQASVASPKHASNPGSPAARRRRERRAARREQRDDAR
jgi:hypothetical protein